MNKPNIFKLENGMTICLLPYKSVDSVTVHLRGLVGSNYEAPNQIGVAHLLEHLLLNSGSKNKITIFGGKIVGVTSRDDVLYMVRTLKENLPDALEFLSGIFSAKQFSKQDLETQKKIVCQEIKRSLEPPEKLIVKLSHKLMFPKQRLAKLNTGNEEDIKRINLKEIQDFYDKNYNPRNFVLSVAGNFSDDSITDYIKKVFKAYKPCCKNQHKNWKLNDKEATQIVRKPEVTHPHVKIDYYGYKLSEEDTYAAVALASLFDTFLKSLCKEVLGLSYNVGCSSFSTGSYGIFSIHFACETENLAQVTELVRSSFNKVSGLISTRNVEQVKHKLLAELVFRFEKASQRADYYSEILLHGGSKQDHLHEISYIKNLNVEKLKEVAGYLTSQKPKTTIITN